jgi:hypothetical protein
MRCKNGTRKNKKTGKCEPIKKSVKRCPNGTRRNKKTKNCEPKIEKLFPNNNLATIKTEQTKKMTEIKPTVTKLLFIEYEVKSCFYYQIYKDYFGKPGKPRKINKLLAGEIKTNLYDKIMQYRTHFIPGHIGVLDPLERIDNFLSEKFGVIHIDHENYYYDENKEKLLGDIEVSVQLNQNEDEIKFEEIETIIFDSFNCTYSSTDYKIPLNNSINNSIKTTDEKFNELHKDIYFEVLETPTNIKFRVENPTGLLK